MSEWDISVRIFVVVVLIRRASEEVLDLVE